MILFDLDGTLVDTTDLILRSFRHAFERHLPGREPSRNAIIATFGTSLPGVLNQMAAAEGHESPEALGAEMLNTYREYQHRHHDSLVQPFPGVREMLETLQRDGQRLGLVTSKMEGFARRGLRLVGLEDFFEVAVFHDDTVEHKPHPEPLLVAAARASERPEHVIYVGDSTHDVVAGRAAGMRTVAVLWGPFEPEALAAVNPDFTIVNPADLPPLVASVPRSGSQG